jgi:transcriptional regulator with XRE-family HTH domain
MTRKLIHAEVGARTAQVRRKLGLKRYEFAKVLGVTPATAGNYEMGQMPRGLEM